jgi:predicted RNA methylase
MIETLNQEKVLEVCDVGKQGLDIIASTSFKSQQSFNLRRGLRIANILRDQFELKHFAGQKILEFGPGHYAFALLARYLGAEVVCVERDPAFAQLGRYLGFEVLEMDFADLNLKDFEQPFDGLWMKGSFNACVQKNEAAIAEFVNRITELISPNGWGWMVTVNKASAALDNAEEFAKSRIEIQRQAFAQAGWDVSLIGDSARPRYALNYTGGLYYFTRGLQPPGEQLTEISLLQAQKTEEYQLEPNVFRFRLSTMEEDPASSDRPFNRVQKLWKPTPEYYLSPWNHYVEFINICRRRRVKFLTMSKALAGDYDPSEINLLLDHHIDFYPIETHVMCRWELENGVISNVYLFNRSPYTDQAQRKIWQVEDLDIEFYRHLENAGFEIGYHQNAIGTARVKKLTFSRDYKTNFSDATIEQARNFFAEDVDNLRNYFNIRTFIPHGAGEGNARLVDLPDGYEDLTWVYNNARRNGSTKPPIKWKNYSDSAGASPQRIRGYKGEYVARRGNLYLAAYMLEPGLNHILVHPGQFSKGMPYELYQGSDEDLQRTYVYESYTLPANAPSLPIQIAPLVSKWLNSQSSSDNHLPKPTSQYSEKSTCQNNTGFLFTDQAAIVRRWLGENELAIPVLVRYRRLSKEERAEVAVKRPVNRKFQMPEKICPSGLTVDEVDSRFLEQFVSFYNLLYSDRLLQHFSESGIEISGLVLNNLETKRFIDTQYLINTLSKIQPDAEVSIHLQSSDVDIEHWRKKLDIAWKQAEDKLNHLKRRFQVIENTWFLEIWS